MATAVAPPATPKTTTSVDPLYTQAIAQAKAALAGETAPIQNEQAASDAQFQQRETDATGVAAALSKLLQPIGPAVNGIYETAAQNQELAANGFSAGMQDALQGNTDNLNAMLKQLGQNVQLDSHAQQAGDVLYGLGGYTPGTSFSKAGAAFGSAAELQSGDAILKGQENVKSLKAQAIVADQGFQAKIAEMAGKLPGDIQTNYTKLQQLSLQDAKFREQVAKDKTDAAYKQAQIKLSTAKYNTDVAYKGAQLKLSGQRLNLEAQRFAQQQVTQDRGYALSLARLGIEQKRLALTATQQEFKLQNGGLSAAQVSRYKSLAQGLSMQAFSSQDKTTKLPVTYKEALAPILQKGVPLSIAQHALDAAGFKPGVRGAPSLHDMQKILADIHFTQSPYSTPSVGSPLSLGGLSKTQALGEISAGAVGRNLDPQAVLAVAAQEGLGGGIGDNGTSFGPWQLHVGGAFPQSVWDAVGHDPAKANAWAWSPQGLNYALDQIAKVAAGSTGQAAIANIVHRFERSAHQGTEIAGAVSAYGRGR